MAISGVDSSYRSNWEASGGAYADLTADETESTGTVWNAVFEDKSSSAIDTDSFLSLIVAQMTNQDFMNPMDDSAMVTQMVQMYSMQAMQEMANQTKTNYVMSMIGKTVTAARITVSGDLQTETGVVEKVSLTNNSFLIYVNGKSFTLEQIQLIGTPEGLGGTESSSGSSSGSTLTEDQIMQRKEYLNSLLGHAVTITVNDEYGSYEIEGVVEKVSTRDGEYRVYVKGEWYSLDDVTEVFGKIDTSEEEEELVDSVDPVDPTDPTDSTDSVDGGDDVTGGEEDSTIGGGLAAEDSKESGGVEETEEPEANDGVEETDTDNSVNPEE